MKFAQFSGLTLTLNSNSHLLGNSYDLVGGHVFDTVYTKNIVNLYQLKSAQTKMSEICLLFHFMCLELNVGHILIYRNV